MKVGEFSEYEGYRGTIEYDDRFDAWFGHVIDADDIYYAGVTIEELYDQFKIAVRKLKKCDESDDDSSKSTYDFKKE